MLLSKLLVSFVLLNGISFGSSHNKNEKPEKFYNLPGPAPFTIKGKIKNYIQDNDNGFVKFRTYSLSGRLKDTAIYINKDGSFEARLYQAFEGDMSFNFRDDFVDLYFVPGGSIHIEIDEKRLKEDGSMTKAMLIYGNNATLSNLVWKYRKAITQQSFKTTMDWADKTKTDEEVALTRIRRMREELNFVKKYLKQHQIVNRTFENWVMNDVVYEAGRDIAFNLFTSARNKSLTPGELMQVLKEVKVENPAALHNSGYYGFLSLLQTDYQIIININPKYTELIKAQGYNRIPLYLDEIDRYSKGLSRQLLYYNLYLTNPSRAADFWDRFNSTIADKDLKGIFNLEKNKLTRAFSSFNIIEKLRVLKMDSLTQSRLVQIFTSKKGRHLFIDFWGSWCAPCMREMPAYPRLISRFEKEKIAFLFLAVDTKEADVINTKQKYGIDGDFLVLSDNEIKVLNNVLGFSSYPRHFLVDADSWVIDNAIGHINFGETGLSQAVVESIEKAIKK